MASDAPRGGEDGDGYIKPTCGG